MLDNEERNRRQEGFRSYTRAIDRLEEQADPKLLALSSRHENANLVPLSPSLPQSWRPVRTLLEDPHTWYAGYLGVLGELDLPMELKADLRERVPQSLLRDVFRPIYATDYVDRIPLDVGLDPGGRQALKEGRQGLVRDPLPVIEPLVEEVIAEQERRRRFLQKPWPTYHEDNAPRVYREIRD